MTIGVLLYGTACFLGGRNTAPQSKASLLLPEAPQVSSFHHAFVAVSDEYKGEISLRSYSPDTHAEYGEQFGALCIGTVHKGDYVNLGRIKDGDRTIRYLAKAW